MLLARANIMMVGGVPAFSPEADALFTRMTSQPNDARKTLINNTIMALKAAGVWDKMDCLYFMAAHDSQAAGLNWKTRIPRYDLVPQNAPTFSVDRGFTGDGVSMYLDTGFQPGVSAGMLTQDNNSFHLFSLSSASSNAIECGNNTNSFRVRSTTSRFETRDMTSAINPTQVNVLTGLGMFSAARNNSATWRMDFNGAKLADQAGASEAPVAVNTWILGRNVDGVLNTPTSRRVAMYGMGAYITEAECANLYSISTGYLQAVGAV